MSLDPISTFMQAAQPHPSRLISYVIPLRDRLDIELKLPADLTEAEVRRLYRLMSTLLIDSRDAPRQFDTMRSALGCTATQLTESAIATASSQLTTSEATLLPRPSEAAEVPPIANEPQESIVPATQSDPVPKKQDAKLGANQLKAIRIRLKWSQARMAREIGIDQKKLSEIELGNLACPASLLAAARRLEPDPEPIAKQPGMSISLQPRRQLKLPRRGQTFEELLKADPTLAGKIKHIEQPKPNEDPSGTPVCTRDSITIAPGFRG